MSAVAGFAMLLPALFPLQFTQRQSSVQDVDLAQIDLTSSTRISDMQIRESLSSFFVENKGQVRDGIRYYSRGNPAIAFRDDGILFVLSEAIDMPTGPRSPSDCPRNKDSSVKGAAYMLRFANSNQVSPQGVGRLDFVVNFFIGNDPARWRPGVPVFREILYEGIYDGIDVAYSLGPDGLKYEFRVEPFANPSAMRMVMEGVESLEIESQALTVRTTLGLMRDSAPYSYQESGKTVDCRFITYDSSSFGFDCGEYDRSKRLTIDPLVYSTFLGASDMDKIYSLAVSSLLRPYVAGWTYSFDFPATFGSFDYNFDGLQDAFVAKFNDVGSLPFFITFIGGTSLDFIYGLALDQNGDAYLTGQTSSTDFPTTPNAFQTTSGGFEDAFVVRLNVTGTFLNYSSYLGGSNVESGESIAVDPLGNAYVTGYTYSTNFPVTPFAYNKTLVRRDAFVTKVFYTGEVIAYSTLLGGSDLDAGYAISVDAAGNAYVTGETWSDDFHTTWDGFDIILNGTTDAFVSKFNTGGSQLLYSTYLGGEGSDLGSSVAMDSAGRLYITGTTSSGDFPVTNGSFDQRFNGGRSDAFVTKIDVTNSTLDYSTYLGGANTDEGSAVAVDSLGVAYVAGTTNSTDFPVTIGAYDPTPCGGTWDVFVTKLKAGGNALLHSTYLAASANEFGHAVAVDSRRDFYVAGETNSISFPTTPGAFRTILGGKWDGFLTKLPSVSPGDPPDLVIGPGYIWFKPSSPVAYGTMVNITAEVHNIGGTNATQIRVRFHDGPPATGNQIGSDVVLPYIWWFSGFDAARVYWLPDRIGTHSVCVVVDPENEIDEMKEDNNEACVTLIVFVAPSADLTLTADNVTFSPPSPVLNGTLVRINATVRNVGAAESVETSVEFLDGYPDAPQIGTDQFLDRIPAGSSLNVSVPWNASMEGTHSICVIVDRDGVAPEYNENNNMACVKFVVEPPGAVKPDYVPIAPSPASDVRIGVSSPLQLSVEVFNSGNASTTSIATLAFYDETQPMLPFARLDIPPVDPGSTSGPLAAMWIAPGIPGIHRLVAHLDYYDDVDEWREDNNQFIWTVEVVTGPITSIVLGAPNCTLAATYVKSSTPLDFSIVDQSGLGIRNTTYSIDGGISVNYTATGTFHLTGEGQHTVDWWSLDWAGNVEEVNSMTLRVDDTPPVTSLILGEPNHVGGGNFVTSSTPLTIHVLDGGTTPVGVLSTRFRVDGGDWDDYSSPFTLAGEGTHTIEYNSSDFLTNQEAVNSFQIIVDDSPPATAISIGEPKYTTGGIYIKTATAFTLSSIDGGVGSNSTFYRLWDGTWTSWQGYSAPFTLAGRDGTWFVEFLSFDYLGNVESVQNQTVILDDTPPATTIYQSDAVATNSTVFTLTATDPGCGVNVTRYRIDGGSWNTYLGGFTLPEGVHNITYYSNDMLNNTEREKWFVVTVEGTATTPPTEVAANYKPLVALVFAIILLVAGVWSSKRRPWKGGKERMAVAKTFTMLVLPFVLLETATGVLSLLTGGLPVPPLIGPGMAVDLAVFLAGIFVEAASARRVNPR